MPLCLDSLTSLFQTPLSDNHHRPALPSSSSPSLPLPPLPSSRIDPISPLGISLLHLYSTGALHYVPDTGTFYHAKLHAQYGVTNYGRVVKYDRKNVWFVYDGGLKQLKAVGVLKANEGFERWGVEELEERMFEEMPGLVERVGRWGGEVMRRVAVPAVVGVVAGAVGARIARVVGGGGG